MIRCCRICLAVGNGEPIRAANQRLIFSIPSYDVVIDNLSSDSAHLKSLRKKIDAAVENIEIARRSGSPIVKAILARSFDQNLKNDSSFGQRNSKWYGEIVFSYPLFSGFSVDKQTQIAVAEKSKAQDVFDEELKQRANIYSLLYSQIGDAEREASSYADLKEADEMASSKSLGRFQAGVGSISDALLAQAELVDSKKISQLHRIKSIT